MDWQKLQFETSFTVMVCTQVVTLPHASVTLHVLKTLVGQNPGLFSRPVYDSLISSLVRVPPQLSVAITVFALGSGISSGVLTLKFWQLTTGGVLSTTLIVCVPVDVLLLASRARQVLVIVYWPAHGPAVVASVYVMVVVLLQLSVADA
jgi:hypothetical protein